MRDSGAIARDQGCKWSYAAYTWLQAKHPKPNDKELRESIAFFKQVQKVMPKRRVILDVCGGHGLVAGLFLSFGHCKRAVVLDTFRPKP